MYGQGQRNVKFGFWMLHVAVVHTDRMAAGLCLLSIRQQGEWGNPKWGTASKAVTDAVEQASFDTVELFDA